MEMPLEGWKFTLYNNGEDERMSVVMSEEPSESLEDICELTSSDYYRTDYAVLAVLESLGAEVIVYQEDE